MGTDPGIRPNAGDIVNLIDRLKTNGVTVRANAAQLLEGLSECIVDWNRKVNLISRKDVKRLVSYHFCDSASLLPIVRPHAEISMLDIGGSNGLPGLVLAAVSPVITVKICDLRRKRKDFMEDACQVVGGGAAFQLERADSQGFRDSNAETFDLIVARAVTRLKQLVKWCVPLLKPGGCLAAYKGSRCLEEVHQAEAFWWANGGRSMMVVGSPWADECNPLRLFAIAGKAREEVVGTWER